MKEIALNEFEANCHFFLEQVEQSGEPLTLLKNGIPFTRILPCQAEKKSLFGMYKGQIKTYGDIVEPIDLEQDVITCAKIVLSVFKGDGLQPGVDLNNSRQLWDLMDNGFD